MHRILTLAALAIAAAAATPALADELRPFAASRWQERAPIRLEHQGDRIEARFDRRGDRLNARLDEQAFFLSEYFARQAARAEAAGDLTLAHRLQVQGERLRQHFDRKGDRLDAWLDRRGEQLARRFEHRLDAWGVDRNRRPDCRDDHDRGKHEHHRHEGGWR